MSYLQSNIDHFVFAIFMSFRLGAFLTVLPAMSDVKVSYIVPIFLSVGLSLLLAPSLSYQIGFLKSMGAFSLLLSIVNEVLIGILMGFAIQILFVMANIIGDLAGLTSGFALATLFDPNLGQVPLMGYFVRIFFIMAFFIFDLHHSFILMVTKSYETLPPGMGFYPFADAVPSLGKLFGFIYLMSFRFVMPMMAIVLLSNLVNGVISITAPQMNIYFNVAITLNIFLGLWIFALSFETLFQFFYEGVNHLNEFFHRFFLNI